MAAEKIPKLTFWQKDILSCPVCDDSDFKREEILSGGGRMNAGNLSDELHRNFLPTAKFGEVYPLLYPVTVCPRCFYAAFLKDFKGVKKLDIIGLQAHSQQRIAAVQALFPNLNFEQNRRIHEGIASYFLAIMCYDYFPSSVSPTAKQAMSSIRGAWLAMDLQKQSPGENWDYVANVFYRKAAFLYGQVVEFEQKGKESAEGLNAGPDVDKNWGFDGIMYLAGLLEFKYGQRTNSEQRGASLKKARSVVAKIVGMGKSSKSKPSAILDLSRDLHSNIKAELEELGID